MDPTAVQAAAAAIRAAKGLLVAAGAGMGVDSGLPDFRGPEGFWRAYPPFRELGLGFMQLANPRWFETDPELAWGFYGHRMRLYRNTTPHAGFGMLLRWAQARPAGGFVFTSNVDGHFQRAGFAADRVYEVHGTVHFQQCLGECGASIFPSGADVDLDEATMRARPPLPSCPKCKGLARPNILMFNDFGFSEDRALEQGQRFKQWLQALGGPLAIVECGAGEAVATVRRTCDVLTQDDEVTLVRINPRECEVPRGQVAIESGALQALSAIDAELARG